MKTYKYWKRETLEFTGPDGKQFKITSLGRSNASISDAASDARARLRKVEAKILGAVTEEKEDYSADIKEEVVKELDNRNVVTRTRYGALVLNTESVTIIDIDNHRKGFLEVFGFKKRETKSAIAEDLEKLAAMPEYSNLGFRVYETSKGIRVIITGKYLDSLAEGSRLMKDCNADPLFAELCRKQQCYRARLTPKPHRIKQKGIKYKWPLEGEELRAAEIWIQEYERKSGNYAVCKYLKTIGRQDMPDRIVTYHDDITRSKSSLPLA